MAATADKAADGQKPKLKAFISYSRRDMAFADKLYAALEARGIDAIIDRRDLPLIEEWQKELLGFIRQADAIIFIISPNSIGSKWCTWEIEQFTALNKRLAPVVAADLPSGMSAPEAITKINYVFFTEGNDFEAQTARLASALNTDISWTKEHTRLGELARRWDERKRSNSLLLRGADIGEAEKWIVTRPREAPRPTELHGQYIAQSRRAHTRQTRFVLIGSLVLAVVMTVAAAFAVYQRDEAERQRVEAELQRKSAQENFEVAHSAADGLVGNLVGGLKDEVGVRTGTVRKILSFAEEAFQKLAVRASGNPKLEVSRANMLIKFAETYATQGDTPKQSEAAEAAVKIATGLKDQGSTETQDLLATAYQMQGTAAYRRGEFDVAETAYDNARKIRETLVAQASGDATAARKLAEAYYQLADLYPDIGKRAEAVAITKNYLADAERFLEKSPYDPKIVAWAARASTKAGTAIYSEGDSVTALPVLLKALRHFEGLEKLVTRTVTEENELGTALLNAGLIRLEQGRKRDAQNYFQRMQAISRRLAASDVDSAERQSELANSEVWIADGLTAERKYADAETKYLSALEIKKRLSDADPMNRAWTRELIFYNQRVGDVRVRSGDIARAAEAYKTGLAIGEKLLALSPESKTWQNDRTILRNGLAGALVGLGENDAAMKLLTDAAADAQTLIARDPQNLEWQQKLGWVHQSLAVFALGRATAENDEITKALAHQDAFFRIAEDLTKASRTSSYYQSELANAYALRADILDKKRQLVKDREASDVVKGLQPTAPAAAAESSAEVDMSAALRSNLASEAIWRQLVASDPSNLTWQDARATASHRIARMRQDAGETGLALEDTRSILKDRLEIAQKEPDDPALNEGPATAYGWIAELLEQQGQLPGALTNYTQKQTLLQGLIAFDPNIQQWKDDLGTVDGQIADIKARIAVDEAIASATSDQERFAAVLKDKPEDAAALEGMVAASKVLADSLSKTKQDSAGAASEREKEIDARLKLAALKPADLDNEQALVTASIEQSVHYRSESRHDDALRHARTAREFAEHLVLRQPDDIDRKRQLREALREEAYATAYVAQAASDAAGFDAALAIQKAQHTLNALIENAAPASTADIQSSAAAYGDDAEMLVSKGDPAAAIPPKREQIAVLERLRTSDSTNEDSHLRDLITAHERLAEIARSVPDWDTAITTLKTVRGMRAGLANRDGADLATQWDHVTSIWALALAFRDSGRAGDALTASREATDILEAEVKGRAANDSQARVNLATAYRVNAVVNGDMGKTSEAIGYYRQSLGVRKTLAEAEPDDEEYLYEQASAESDLALILAKTGDAAAAASGLQRAEAILAKLSAEMQDTEKVKGTKAMIASQLAELPNDPAK